MGSGTVVGATKIVDNGPDADNWNLVMVGDGYPAGSPQTWFADWVTEFIIQLQATSPFGGSVTWARVNVYRVDVESDESGAIDPAVCADGTLPFAGVVTNAASYFDAEYCSAGIRRALVVDSASVMLEVGALVPDWEAIIVAVNHREPGGTAGAVGTSYVMGNTDGTAIHELGHLFNLGDEYSYLEGCDSGEAGLDVYTGSAPSWANLTIDTNRTTIKWASYIDALTPLPTTVNPDATQCDAQESPVAAGEIGAFEGGGHYHSGIYRPAQTCMMRHSEAGGAFCKVCLGVILSQIILEESTCFVATAVYEDPWASDVVSLRSWRDRHLRDGARGARGMLVLNAAYGVVGPRLARSLRGHRRAMALLRWAIFVPWARLVRRGEGTSWSS